MLFNSPVFIFSFLPLVFLAFVVAGRLGGQVGAVAVLVVASLVFYAYWRIDDLALLAVSIAVNYQAAAWLDRLASEGRQEEARYVLAGGLAFNLGLITWFKYAGLIGNTIDFAFVANLSVPDVRLPLGISFFTFTQIAYLVDVFARRTTERSPLRYALFVTLFPHLIAGPIIHQAAVGPQFRRPGFGRPTFDEVSVGLTFFVAGLFKKVLLADSIATFSNPIFNAAGHGDAITLWEAWGGVLAYTMQIYFDFSGYSDMAIGLGLMFGIRLPINFNSPYKAVSIIDFWRRWHITLSRFLRDYLYIPLGGNRHGSVARYCNLMITMLLGGLWHGANWTFVLWGGVHGLMICINHAWRWLAVPDFGLPSLLRLWAARAVTFLAVALAWIPFRAESLDATGRLLRAMSGVDGVPLPQPIASLLGVPAGSMFANATFGQGGFWLFQILGLTNGTIEGVAALAMLLAICMLLPNTQDIMRYDPDRCYEGQSVVALPVVVSRRPIAAGAVLSGAFWLCVFALNRPTQFLYFNF